MVPKRSRSASPPGMQGQSLVHPNKRRSGSLSLPVTFNTLILADFRQEWKEELNRRYKLLLNVFNPGKEGVQSSADQTTRIDFEPFWKTLVSAIDERASEERAIEERPLTRQQKWKLLRHLLLGERQKKSFENKAKALFAVLHYKKTDTVTWVTEAPEGDETSEQRVLRNLKEHYRSEIDEYFAPAEITNAVKDVTLGS